MYSALMDGPLCFKQSWGEQPEQQHPKQQHPKQQHPNNNTPNNIQKDQREEGKQSSSQKHI